MFFSKKRKASGHDATYSVLNADMHSHLLPDIDDGSPDLETSVRLIKGLHELGYRKLITTPHILWDMYKNTSSIIQEKLELVRTALREKQIDVELQAAAEYYIDEHLGGLLERKEPLLTFGNKMVLVEFSMVSQPYELKTVLFDMQMQGYQPVLAHPERYIYFEKNKTAYDELKNSGYLFQLNALSLSGHYGHSVMKLARYLASAQYYDLIGTDLHHYAHLEALRNPATLTALEEVLDSGKIINSTI